MRTCHWNFKVYRKRKALRQPKRVPLLSHGQRSPYHGPGSTSILKGSFVELNAVSEHEERAHPSSFATSSKLLSCQRSSLMSAERKQRSGPDAWNTSRSHGTHSRGL